jgi:hypothetical protein
LFIFAGAAGIAPACAAPKPETRHLAFVTEYVRDLVAIESIRDSAKQELKDADDMGKLSSGIHINTLFELELQSEVAMLKGMRLSAPYNDLIPSITSFYEFKITVFKRMTEVLTTILGGAGGLKPNVDYGALAAEMPALRARLDYLDHTLFSDVSPLVFLTLVDPKPDSKNHVSHMIITEAERERLLESLSNDFGEKMDQKDQNFGVGSAAVLRSFLKERKCSDEPWE